MSVCIVGCACVLNCHQTVSWGRYSGEMDTDLLMSASVFLPPVLLQHSLCTVAASHGSER